MQTPQLHLPILALALLFAQQHQAAAKPIHRTAPWTIEQGSAGTVTLNDSYAIFSGAFDYLFDRTGYQTMRIHNYDNSDRPYPRQLRVRSTGNTLTFRIEKESIVLNASEGSGDKIHIGVRLSLKNGSVDRYRSGVGDIPFIAIIQSTPVNFRYIIPTRSGSLGEYCGFRILAYDDKLLDTRKDKTKPLGFTAVSIDDPKTSAHCRNSANRDACEITSQFYKWAVMKIYVDQSMLCSSRTMLNGIREWLFKRITIETIAP